IERELDNPDGAFRIMWRYRNLGGYRVAWSWVCGSPGAPYDIGASWDMNERAWNIDKVNDKGETIEATRYGISINHTYETSSYGLPENGPSSGVRQPAYQVQLTTHWLMAAKLRAAH
ncbi:MAG: hypothetical protein HC853_04650, partial [Anaerolineae bacterium]|nr:hypothetical protein [Anaerolineae bacterium]